MFKTAWMKGNIRCGIHPLMAIPVSGDGAPGGLHVLGGPRILGGREILGFGDREETGSSI